MNYLPNTFINGDNRLVINYFIYYFVYLCSPDKNQMCVQLNSNNKVY